MPQFTATSTLWLSIENRLLNGPASQLPASWNQVTMSFEVLASRTIIRIATTRIPTATAVAARITPARNSISYLLVGEVLPGDGTAQTGTTALRFHGRSTVFSAAIFQPLLISPRVFPRLLF